MNANQLRRAPLYAAVVAALALSACGRDNDNRTAGQKLDSTIATVDRKTDQMTADAKAGMQNAKESAKEAAQDVKQATSEATKEAGAAISDASITASVNAELAKDASLSALKIDVDTSEGRVELKGTAPNAAAKDRATQLASSVKGVVKVDNKLTVSGAS